MLQRGNHVEFLPSDKAPAMKGKKNFIKKLILSLKRKIYRKRVLNKYRDFDIIYSAMTGSMQMNYYSRLKEKGKMKAKLIAVLHHPVNTLKYPSAYHKILFLSKGVETGFTYPHKEYLFWGGPDLSYYDYWINKLQKNREMKDIIFISNGKSHRNHDEFLYVADKLQVKAIVTCDNTTLPEKKYLNNKNFNILYPNNSKRAITSNENIELVLSADVMVIPVRTDNIHLCGLTSFVDAIALGKPVIMSDNTFIDIDIEKEGFGFIYKAGDVLDLEAKMNVFLENKFLALEMGKRAREFAQKMNFKDVWAKRLLEIIEE